MSAQPLPEKIITRETLGELAQSGRLYAALDACDAPWILEKVTELPNNQVSCLYSNQAEEDYSSFSPYLFTVDSDLLDWTYRMVAQEGGGLLIVTDTEHDALRKHLRRFLLVLAPNGEEMYFRYYDPRVLPKFLAACTEEEQRDLFGPILAFGLIQDREIKLLQEQAGSLPETAPPRPTRAGLFQTRPDHLKAFWAEAKRAFEYRLAEHLREYHKELVEVFPEDILHVLIQRGIARARRYGLFSEADLTAFVAIMFEIAPNFDQHPYIHDVLTDRRLLPTEKIDALVQRVPDFVWEEADRQYDEDAWEETEVA